MAAKTVQTGEQCAPMDTVSPKSSFQLVSEPLSDPDNANVFRFETSSGTRMNREQSGLRRNARRNVRGDEFSDALASERIGILYQIHEFGCMVAVNQAVPIVGFLYGKERGY